jgi:hypothetical protein
MSRSFELPEGSEWVYELKLDGYRAIGVRTSRETILYSRNHKNFNKRFPQIAETLSDLARHSRNSSLKPSGLCLQPLKACGFYGACYNCASIFFALSLELRDPFLLRHRLF